jgi:hypothetical protein
VAGEGVGEECKEDGMFGEWGVEYKEWRNKNDKSNCRKSNS